MGPPTAAERRAAEELRAEGNKLFGRGKFSAAADRYTEAITLDPGSAALFVNRALCARKQGGGAWGRVQADAAAALALEPNNLKAHYLMGGPGWRGELASGRLAARHAAAAGAGAAAPRQPAGGGSPRRRAAARALADPRPPPSRRAPGLALREQGAQLSQAISHLTKALEAAREKGDSIKDEIWCGPAAVVQGLQGSGQCARGCGTRRRPRSRAAWRPPRPAAAAPPRRRELAKANDASWRAQSEERRQEMEALRAQLHALAAAARGAAPGSGAPQPAAAAAAAAGTGAAAGGQQEGGGSGGGAAAAAEAELGVDWAALERVFSRAAAPDARGEVPSAFTCPLTMEVYRDPVVGGPAAGRPVALVFSGAPLGTASACSPPPLRAAGAPGSPQHCTPPFRLPPTRQTSASGHTYERAALVEHLTKVLSRGQARRLARPNGHVLLDKGSKATGSLLHGPSRTPPQPFPAPPQVGAFEPITRAPMTLADVRPNIAMRSAVTLYLEEHAWAWHECY
jgi:hypothetical protein